MDDFEEKKTHESSNTSTDPRRIPAISLVILLTVFLLALPFGLIGWSAHGIWSARKKKPADSSPTPTHQNPTEPSLNLLRQAAESQADRFFGQPWRLTEVQSPIERLQLEASPEEAQSLLSELRKLAKTNPTAAVELETKEDKIIEFLLRPDQLPDTPQIEHLRNSPGWSNSKLLYLDIKIHKLE